MATGGRLDRLGTLIGAIIAVGALLPFASLRANRIVQGEGVAFWQALPVAQSGLLLAALCVAVIGGLLLRSRSLRLVSSLGALAALLILMGQAGNHLTPADNDLARVSPASGFWVLLFGLSLAVADALTRLNLLPVWRIFGVFLTAAALVALLGSGQWDALSVMKEYDVRAATFWREAQRHLMLAFGSLLAAVVVGVPLGIVCFRLPRVRATVLNLLNIVQTIPSIAVFGLLIAPLAWLAANIPGAAASGISGIGAAPALVALFAYSLLPVVSNTLLGLENVPARLREAAFGMGMTRWQTLSSVEAPLAFPVILTGIRIVLVQNIGLATIAGLIGGGGFRSSSFRGWDRPRPI